MSWKPEVKVGAEWVANALRFDTKMECDAYLKDLMWRWTLVDDTRAVSCDDTVKTAWVNNEIVSLEDA